MANRLARESSPYLLLHAQNPVDWYPWGEEAFERARHEEKPIFLSIGYSTCYWCHVMERESFSDPAIAHELNEGFVCVKVDREERPDIDAIYMTATQLITRSGGWPNTVFLTPELKPFFAGTYFPPRDASGRPGLPRVLQGLRQSWLFRRAEVQQQAEMVAQAMEQSLSAAYQPSSSLPGTDLGGELQRALAARFDAEWGGFGDAPKFPSPANLVFLLERAGDPEARRMLLATLDHMARGGLQDHLAGGFHRYATDEAWLVPHFEKMLYDNAALAGLYAEASQLAPGDGFEGVARATLDFVLRELLAEGGAFRSAIDAETDGHEGAFYTWTAEELDQALSGPDGELFMNVYGVEGPPPFEGDRYVLHLPVPLAEAARTAGTGEPELLRRLERGRRALLEARERRKRPLTDDKVLTDWNGLMIAALARAGALLGEPRYLEAARRAASFLGEALVDPATGTLLHSWRDGRAHVPAFLEDYAFLIQGLLELHEASGEPEWAEEAIRLAEEQEERLGDEAGGYFLAGPDPRLLFRAKTGFDGALASGNGVSVLNLIELARLTGEPVFAQRAQGALLAFADGMAQAPLAHVTLIRALERFRLERPAADATDRAATGPAAGAVPAPAAPPVAMTLEQEAEDAVEITGSLGSAVEDDWKPFRVELAVKKGWHTNANPAGEGLVPTSVAGVLGPVRNVRYPAGEAWDGGGGTVRVYQGRVTIEGEIERRGGGAPAVEVGYQACDASRCLPAVTRIVRLR